MMGPVANQLVSGVVVSYLRRSPIRRGKWKLLRWASSFLTVPVSGRMRVRISDPSNPVESALSMYGLREEEDLARFRRAVAELKSRSDA